MIHTVTYGDRQGYIRVLRFTDPARAYVALHNQCERDELTQIKALWAMRQLAEVCREIYASESMAAAGKPGGLDETARYGGPQTATRGTGPLPPYTGAGDAACVTDGCVKPAAASETTRRPPSEQSSSGGPQGCETRPGKNGPSATSGVLGRCAVRLPAAGLISENTGAGDAVARVLQAAAESQDTPPPSLYSWFLWLIGVTR